MNKHDKIATRLSLILTKFNNGEKLSVEALATEFNVTTRTIQRDLNERFADIPLKKENKLYFLDAHYLGKVTFDDINNFAHFSGVNKMFPSFGNEFLQHLLDRNVADTYLIKTHNFEDIKHKIDDFNLIEKAIIEQKVLKLLYREQKREVYPYKFANVKGIWYLVALQNGVIKTFTFTKITHLQIFDKSFVVDHSILEKIENEESLWFSNQKTEVILKVKHSVAEYFLRRKILPCQQILEKCKDGGLMVLTQMTFEEEILQMVRYWIPNVRIVSPVTLGDKLNKSLKEYLK